MKQQPRFDKFMADTNQTPAVSNIHAPLVKCSRCTFWGTQSAFPHKANLQYSKSCASCVRKLASHRRTKGENAEKENEGVRASSQGRKKMVAGEIPTLPWASFLLMLEENKGKPFVLEAFMMDRNIGANHSFKGTLLARRVL